MMRPMPKIAGLGTSRLSPRELAKRGASIRLLVLDVDGVLTDGGMYYGPDGEVLKRFDTRDGQGIAMALKAGLTVAFLTRESTPFAAARARKLGVEYCIIGSLDKPVDLRRLQEKLGVTAAQTAYVGDDEGDRPCIGKVGIFFTPGDSWLTLKDGVDVVLAMGGGRGAVRLAIQWLLGLRKPRA